MKTTLLLIAAVILHINAMSQIFPAASCPRENPFEAEKQRIKQHFTPYKHLHLQATCKTHETKKTTDEIRMGLDSLVMSGLNPSSGQWEPGIKFEYTYNFLAQLIQEDIYGSIALKSGQGLLLTMRTLYEYHASGQISLQTTLFRDEISGELKLAFKTETVYNAHNQPVLTTYYVRDQDEWIPNRKTEYIYDNGNLKTEIYSKYQTAWTPWYKYEYAYNTNGNLHTETRYNWEASQSDWKPYNKQENQYNAANMLSEYIIWEWPASGTQWEQSWRRTLLYNANNLMTEYTDYHWTVGSGQWQPSFRQQYTWNSQNRLTLSIEYDWNTSANLWENLRKEEYEYDSNSNPMTRTLSDWDPTGNAWVYNRRTDFVHDLSYTINQLMFPPELYLNYFSNHMLTELNEFDWDDVASAFVASEMSKLYYSEHVVAGIPAVMAGKLEIRPNPATDYVEILTDKPASPFIVEVFNTHGIKVFRCEKACEQINVRNWAPGLYFIRLQQEGKVMGAKLMVN